MRRAAGARGAVGERLACFASAISSFRFFAGSEGCATRISVASPSLVTGAKSSSVSNGIFGEHVRVDHHRAVEAEQQRVAVGRGLRDRLRADVAARARPVLDDHRLAEARAERLGHHARAVVGDAARRERHDRCAAASAASPARSRWRRRSIKSGRERGQSNFHETNSARACNRKIALTPFRVELRYAPLPLIGAIAVHYWFVVYDERGDLPSLGSMADARMPAAAVSATCTAISKSPRGRRRRRAFAPRARSGTARGAAHRRRARGARSDTRMRERYRYWPGPNSNSFVAWVLRAGAHRLRFALEGIGRRWRK